MKATGRICSAARRIARTAAAALLAAALAGSIGRGHAALEPGAEAAARAYLTALLQGDMPTLRRLTPRQLENKFGPCPFVEMPRLESPRVDAHRAGILFKGKTRDPDLPDQGGLTLTRLDNVPGNPWRVRQVFYFNELPLGAKFPRRSITRRDEAWEPKVVEAARRYLAAWLAGDYKTMQSLAFDWLARQHDPYPGLKIRSIEFRASPSERGETRISFTAKLTVFWTLPKTVSGTLFAMREDGEWKVRGNELMF